MDLVFFNEDNNGNRKRLMKLTDATVLIADKTKSDGIPNISFKSESLTINCEFKCGIRHNRGCEVAETALRF